MHARGLLSAVILAVVAAVFSPAAATASGYRAGAAAVVITPPHETGHRVGELACPVDVWDGPSMWEFDEPYVDANDDGHYNVGDPYCDANANGRYDGIWVVGQVNHPAEHVHDDIFVRTFVVARGSSDFVALSSVDSLGLFNTDIQAARDIVLSQHPDVADIIVSADHNESSPDSIGLWGPGGPNGEDVDGAASLTSGVNDYYMSFLATKIAESVTLALADARPARLNILETTAPTIIPTLNHWPTTNRKDATTANPSPQAAGRIDAWDPKVHILQAKDEGNGDNIFTLVDYDAHIQNLGHSDDDYWSHSITADWVQFFNRDIEAQQGGVVIYLQGANGSIETPSVPTLGNYPEGTPERSEAIGTELAKVVNENVGAALPLVGGDVDVARESFTVPLENQLFMAAFAAHLFPHKLFGASTTPYTYPQMQTEVGIVNIGPLQFLANPGEAFPALTKGSHWGIDEGCSGRPNPPVPSWSSSADYRWDVGLADDMIGYESPAWSWDSDQTTYENPLDPCSNDSDEQGHHHGLEDESVGPTGGNIVAAHLSVLAKAMSHGAPAEIATGRYLFADGSLSRRPYRASYQRDDGPSMPAVTTRAIGVVVGYRVFMLPGFTDAGTYHATGEGTFVDYDGHAQSDPDQGTRGMSTATGTIFVDVYPA
ncbi:MAG: hypothetical protein ABR548_14610 [Actinomycetota bacterium]|nr:hypothetical protein [Actinomycetota bacterium]